MLATVGLLLVLGSVRPTIISKSEINTCEASDAGVECRSKLFVNIVLQNGGGLNEELAFNLSKIKNQRGEEINLDKPLRLRVQKSRVEVAYNTIYLQDVNFFPQEQVIDSSYLSCSQGTYLGSLKLQDSTCSVKRDKAGLPIKESQGYCCSCPVVTYLAGLRSGTKRGDCGFLSSSMSAHCLYLPNYWFSLFEIPSYTYNYVIGVKASFVDRQGKEVQSEMFLSNTKKSVNGGVFSVKVIGVAAADLGFRSERPSSDPQRQVPAQASHPCQRSAGQPQLAAGQHGHGHAGRQPVQQDRSHPFWLPVSAEQVRPGKRELSEKPDQASDRGRPEQEEEEPGASLLRLEVCRLDSREGEFWSSQDSNGTVRLNLMLKSDMSTSVLLEVDATDMVFSINV